jgi:hypothetical protein
VTKLVRIFVLAFALASLGSMPIALAGNGKGDPTSATNGSEACDHASANSEVITSGNCIGQCDDIALQCEVSGASL